MGRREKRKIRAEEDWQQVHPQVMKRLMMIGVIATLILTGLGGRLFYIQFSKHDLYTTEVSKQRNITIPLSSGRGMILDRNLIPLTDREEETVAIIFPQLFTANEENLGFLSEITQISALYLNDSVTMGGYPIELSVKAEVDWTDRRLVNTRGLFVVNRRKRYGTDDVLSHTLGYISGADRRGITGIERAMDSYLSDQVNESIIAILDGRKRLLPGEGYTLNYTSEKEQHVQLTIDYPLQKLAEELLDQRSYQGAIVVSKVDTGELLVLASRPNFNPNQISEHINSQGDELYHRGIQMTFPPGSIFKIVVTAAALEQGITTLDENFYCSGSETVGNIEIKCSSYENGGNGDLNFEEAFAKSCNSTFIQIGQRLGTERVIEMAKRLGFGERIGIQLSEEERGYLPQGDQLLGPAIGNLSIGQGELEVTPLQINQLTQIVANQGVRSPLYLIDRVVDKDYETLYGMDREEGSTLLSADTAEKLQYLMEKTMYEGTGRGVGSEYAHSTGGKTGTAQSSWMGESVVHAWFTGYYPAESPQYAITVFIQNGRSGSGAAVPIFKQLLDGIEALGY